MEAYVLIQANANGEPLAQKLEALPDVLSAQEVSGAYDAIALTRSSSEQDLLDRVLREIRSVPGVTRALPAPLRNGSSPHSAPSDGRSEPADAAA
ncbi:MAG: Lrp/AsnC ligand binding domain-containing protein [Actinomycetota bacterium]|nr:Lrp/AsnC ligand binding domain-containing protein [Actinomycetota bacterium]